MCNLGVVWDGDREQPTCGIASFILFFLFRARGIQFWICVLGILICIKIQTNTTNSLQRDRFLHHFANISYCVRWNARTRAKRVMWIIAQLFAHMSEHTKTHTHTHIHMQTHAERHVWVPHTFPFELLTLKHVSRYYSKRTQFDLWPPLRRSIYNRSHP